MRKILMIAAIAASIGGFATSANQASAAVSTSNIASVEKPQAAKDGTFQVARRGNRGRGFRHGGRNRHRGYRRAGHGHRGPRWGQWYPSYYDNCVVNYRGYGRSPRRCYR